LRRAGGTIRHDILEAVRRALSGKYTVDREIGRGGAARVFQAVDAGGRTVALKVLHPQLVVSVTAQRFLREISLLEGMEHPNIARLLDYGESDYLVYYAMTYVEGPTLRQHLARVQRMNLSDTLRTGRDLIAALSYAHQRGIVHRDVKPENVVLARTGAVLMDFGIARAIAASGTERLTRSGFTVGTSAYMSPEQVAGSLDIDHRGDIYSLGCVLFECLAGRPPFVHPHEDLVLQMQREEPVVDVRTLRREVPERLAQVVARALEKQRERRWQSAEEMGQGLAAVSV
jgi:serine/threonine-protein kinase